jgi:hypothetical protein
MNKRAGRCPAPAGNLLKKVPGPPKLYQKIICKFFSGSIPYEQTAKSLWATCPKRWWSSNKGKKEA